VAKKPDELKDGDESIDNTESSNIDSSDRNDLSNALWKISYFGFEEYQKDNGNFVIAGWLRELWYRRVEEAKKLYIENNALFNSGIPKDKLFEENSEGYKYVMEYASKSTGRKVPEDEDFQY